jgi:hypothetical protein
MQREQYRGTVHLFIGTGRSPDKITSMSLITNYDHNTYYQGLYSLFLFRSVSSFVFNMTPSRSSLNRSFSLYLHVTHAFVLSYRRCFFPRGPSAKKKTPNRGIITILHNLEDLSKMVPALVIGKIVAFEMSHKMGEEEEPTSSKPYAFACDEHKKDERQEEDSKLKLLK